MARGQSRADSELSRSLRAKAQYLRVKNEAERQEAEQNETEYDRAMKSAIMRAQDEVDEEFKGKRMEVDEEEQSKREAEALKAEEDAKAEEAREAAEESARKAREANVKTVETDLENSPHPHSNWGYLKSEWAKASGVDAGDKPSLYPDTDGNLEDRLYLKPEYIAKAIENAPAAIRDAVKASLDAFSLDNVLKLTKSGNRQPIQFSLYDDVASGFYSAYLKGAFGKGANKGKADLEMGSVYGRYRAIAPDGEPATTKQHDAGMKRMRQLDTYLAKVLKNSDGNTINHPDYKPEEE